ncbi:phosphatase PAP2 family protein [Pediococcus argentinicus]|uniref:phosphatase PAP2 family protein n=1 Tax=Pediococcus argentinicus TaxID=480391 RepID=UPI00338FD02F
MLNNSNGIPKRYVWTSGIIFILLMVMVKGNVSIIQTLDNFLGSLLGNGHNAIMSLISTIADTKMGFIYAIIIAAVLWFRQQRVDSVWVLATMFGGSVIAFIVKEIVQRHRPYPVVDTGFSFPSGHTFEAFLILSFIYLYFIRPLSSASTKRFAFYALVVWQLLVMWSRVYLGAHYLSDTIGALTLAVVWLWIAMWLYKRLYEMVANIVNPAVGKHQKRH